VENVKGSPIEGKRLESLSLGQSSVSTASNTANLLMAGHPVLLCQRVKTVRPELLLEVSICGFEASVFRDTGDVAEVGFGQQAELRLPATCPTTEAMKRVKHFASRELTLATLSAVKPTELGDLALLARHWQPRVHAAFAFDPNGARIERELSELWTDFGGAYCLVPKVTYVQVRGESYLCYVVTPPAAPESATHNVETHLRQVLDRLTEAERVIAGLERYSNVQSPAAARQDMPEVVEQTPQPAWNELVRKALHSITSGELEKVVAARFAKHAFAQPVSLFNVLYALGNTHPNSTRFAFCGRDATFMGATPEHLISKYGQTLTTEALAGTTPSALGASQAFSPKEYHEHSPVLDAILNCLGPFCSDLTHEVTPLPLRLPHVLHLRTAIFGTLKNAETHVLDLVEALHPTPAVAGAPRDAALQWLSEHEDFERGWYAGPVGWFDADGNGQFDVALRCGVLTQDRAILFAGAGIVEGSEPEKEFEETVLKLKAMQTALVALPPTFHHENSKA
jgi:isochorismate synthase